MPILKTGRLLRPLAADPNPKPVPDPRLRRQLEQAVAAQVAQAAEVITAQAQAAQDKKEVDQQARIKAQIDYMRRVAGQDAGGKVSKVVAGVGRALPPPSDLYGFPSSPPTKKRPG